MARLPLTERDWPALLDLAMDRKRPLAGEFEIGLRELESGLSEAEAELSESDVGLAKLQTGASGHPD